MIVEEIMSGIVSGLTYALISSVFIIFLSMIFKYFTNETFPWFVSTVLGLGIMGISGGLLAILDEPSPLSVTRILVASLVFVWATNQGDKLAARLPKKTIHLIPSLKAAGRQDCLILKVPDERDIIDIPGKPRVSVALKRELAGKEFILPGGLPKEELVSRVRRRLLADWGLGDAELELDQQDRFAFFAISAREEGLSGDLREGFLAFPMEYSRIPCGLARGDFVMVYSGKDLLLDSVEVRVVDEANKTITLVVESTQLQRCIGKDATQIIALPETHRKLMVKDIMARNVRALGPLASVADAISLMTRYRIGSAVVVEGDKTIGILTDGDVLHRLVHRQSDIKSTPVRDWMSQPIVDVSSDVSVDEALTIMRNRNVKKLPVTSEGRLVGMVTSNDIYRASSSMS